MRYSFRHYSKYAPVLFVFILALSLTQLLINGGFLGQGVVEAKISQETIAFDKANPQIQAVMAVQDRHTPGLMALPEVVGTATGLTEAGRPAVLVFTKNRVEAGMIPDSLEGIPVVVKVTGEIIALKKPDWAGGLVVLRVVMVGIKLIPLQDLIDPCQLAFQPVTRTSVPQGLLVYGLQMIQMIQMFML